MRMIAPRTGAPEITLAEEQTEYAPVTVAVYAHPDLGGARTLFSRWRLTPEERERVAAGEDIYLGLVTFDRPMQPIMIQVGSDGLEVSDGSG